MHIKELLLLYIQIVTPYFDNIFDFFGLRNPENSITYIYYSYNHSRSKFEGCNVRSTWRTLICNVPKNHLIEIYSLISYKNKLKQIPPIFMIEKNFFNYDSINKFLFKTWFFTYNNRPQMLKTYVLLLIPHANSVL